MVCNRNYTILIEPSGTVSSRTRCSSEGNCRLSAGTRLLDPLPRKYNSHAYSDAAFDESLLQGLQIVVPYMPVMQARNLAKDRALALRQQQLEAEFNRLASVWHRDTCISSRLDKILFHWAYRRIISMGSGVVPFIIRKLTQRIDHWFWALMFITGENPGAQAENMEEMAAAWIEWGKGKGYLND